MSNIDESLEFSKEKWSLFQFGENENYPIFVLLELKNFDENLTKILLDCHFRELSDKEAEKTWQERESKFGHRILKLVSATKRLELQIGLSRDTDDFGLESLNPKEQYNVYRFKGLALMVYSSLVTNWEMGVLKNFGSKEFEFETRMVLSRYLGWSLAPHGVVGFWGEVTDGKMFVSSARQTSGRSFFVDYKNQKQIVSGMELDCHDSWEFIRANDISVGGKQRMTQEELLAFLSSKTVFFDYRGLSVPVRQVIGALSKSGNGIFALKGQSGKKEVSI